MTRLWWFIAKRIFGIKIWWVVSLDRKLSAIIWKHIWLVNLVYGYHAAKIHSLSFIEINTLLWLDPWGGYDNVRSATTENKLFSCFYDRCKQFNYFMCVSIVSCFESTSKSILHWVSIHIVIFIYFSDHFSCDRCWDSSHILTIHWRGFYCTELCSI